MLAFCTRDLVPHAGAEEKALYPAAAYALRVVFDSHLAKENDLVLPVVAADPLTSLAGILHGMHELLGGKADDEQTPAGQSAGDDASCGCGHEDEDAVPGGGQLGVDYLERGPEAWRLLLTRG